MSTSGALQGRRILDLADEKGAYCGKLFADLGADVIKVEPPSGDPTRVLPPWRDGAAAGEGSLFFLYMNGNKRSLVLDLAAAADRTRFLDLAAGSDVVLETHPPGALDALGVGAGALRSVNPRLVLASITSFGQSGPRRDFAGGDLVAAAFGGAMYVTGDADDPPVRLAGRQACISASLCAAAATLIALRHADRTGRGQHVDVSLLEATVAASHICGIGKWLDDGLVARRSGTGLFASVPSGAYRCRDGLVYLMVNRPRHWRALAEWIHEVTGMEGVLDPLFDGPSSNRLPYRDLVDTFVGELTARLTVGEAYHEGQRRHLAFTPVRTAAEVAADPHLAVRGFFVDVPQRDGGVIRMPGAPYRLSETPWAMRRPAPALGEHGHEIENEARAARGHAHAVNDATVAASEAVVAPREAAAGRDAAPGGALAGLRVLELTAAMAGPWIGRFMAACGAEVIRVESRQHPDVVRLYVPPRAPERGTQPQCSPWFTDWNAGKRFVALDLTQPRAVDIARRLAACSDVVIENYSAGVVDKLGLGYETLRRLKPDLVMLGTSGYGAHGPQRGYVTWGPNIEALSGLATLSGFPERACTITQYAYPDVLGALHGLFAVLSALEARDRSGRGQYVDLAQLETGIAAVGEEMLEYFVTGREPPRRGNRSASAAPHGCYRCRGEDRHCVIAVESDPMWARFCAAVGAPEWRSDPRFVDRDRRLANAAELDALIEAWTSGRSAEEVMAHLQAAGVAAGVVQNVADLVADPQLAARGFHEEVEHAVFGTVRTTGIPLGLTATPARSGRAGQAVGQDNDDVLREVLGMTDDEIRAAKEAGAIE